MSPWERPIDAKRIVESARKQATLIVNQRIYSRPGAFAVMSLNKIPFFSVEKNETFWRVKVSFDEGVENTLGKLFSTFAGTSLFMLLRKN